ncbi:hypothetical protein ACFFHH_17345 [Cytobacillus solani]|nr:hypothetical protein [Cytobacillus solani]USK56763.1 hypothetical protein LIS82_09935 [Cytobacillus solani]
MNQKTFGLGLFIFLIIPPVANLMESVMIIHMHMQMPILVITGFLMAPFFQSKFSRFFEKWNHNGIPGILLFIIIVGYWMLPRTMDEALELWMVELFKFISLPFLAGVPLRDSWKKLEQAGKNTVIIIFSIAFIVMGWLYINATMQLCNNYLLIEQITLGWGFLTMGIAFVIFLGYRFFFNPSAYE